MSKETLRCARCKEPYVETAPNQHLQCSKCGGRVFYKARPNVKKTIEAC